MVGLIYSTSIELCVVYTADTSSFSLDIKITKPSPMEGIELLNKPTTSLQFIESAWSGFNPSLTMLEIGPLSSSSLCAMTAFFKKKCFENEGYEHLQQYYSFVVQRLLSCLDQQMVYKQILLNT
jgi:hypothetical protein